MKPILCWPLQETIAVCIAGEVDGLCTITGCSIVHIELKKNEKTQLLYTCKASELSRIYDMISDLIEQQKDSMNLGSVCFIHRQSQDFLLTVIVDNHEVCKELIDLNTLISWNRQLELLKIVMDENSLEKQEKNKGCC